MKNGRASKVGVRRCLPVPVFELPVKRRVEARRYSGGVIIIVSTVAADAASAGRFIMIDDLRASAEARTSAGESAPSIRRASARRRSVCRVGLACLRATRLRLGHDQFRRFVRRTISAAQRSQRFMASRFNTAPSATCSSTPSWSSGSRVSTPVRRHPEFGAAQVLRKIP